MYKPSSSSVAIAERASKLIPSYGNAISNPFTAIEERVADCIGGILLIQAVRQVEDPVLKTVRHSIMFQDKQTGIKTPYIHYLGINTLGDVIDMSECVRAVNRTSYSSRLAANTEIAEAVDELLANATRLNVDTLKIERLIDRGGSRTSELHRIAYIDDDQLLGHVARGRTMDELRIETSIALERAEATVV